MKRYLALAGFAFAILAFSSVWLGGLNQDEGWYLYAAQLVSEGRMPYRDFFYTQGPLMPTLYSSLTWVWQQGGILGARILTCGIGLAGMVFAAVLARLLAPQGRKGAAGVVAFMLLGCNLYHIYYTSIPKTYALASLFATMGYYLLGCALTDFGRRFRPVLLFTAGLTLALASGVRISLGVLLAVCGFGLLFSFRRLRWSFLWFGLGGVLGLAVAYGAYLVDADAFRGLYEAQRYHAARGGFDPVFTIGSFSRLVRWYLPLFVLLGLGVTGCLFVPRAEDSAERRLMLVLAAVGFAAVFAVQMLAPFPYEDYQVPVMGLLAVVAAVLAVEFPLFAVLRLDAAPPSPWPVVLLALGMTWASSFGSPLLERWMTNGQDRFWSLKKEKCELAQLRDIAKVIESIDPGGKTLLTQDLYLAIETRRRVPDGLEMGPFSVLTDDEWKNLLSTASCEVAALSGYSFAIKPPRCAERPIEQQMEYWGLLKSRYDLVMREDDFGQNATTLLILKKKADK